MMTIVAVTEAFALVAMGFAIAALMPLQKVVPMVITSNDKGDEIIRVNPTTLESPTADYVTEIQLRSEEHTSELQSLMRISYAVFCLKKKTHITTYNSDVYHKNNTQYN